MTITSETEMQTIEAAPAANVDSDNLAESSEGNTAARVEGVDLEAVQEQNNNNNNNDSEDDDDDITIIMLDQNTVNESRNRPEDAFAWIDSTSPEMEERRRNVLVRELRRVQRASFIHFVLLCLIPTALLVIVIATVVGDEENCESDVTFCELEPRSFMNAFTTRCVCDAIPVDRLD